MKFEELERTLNRLGFDTSISDGILLGRSENGDSTIEINIDQGGECLVKKSKRGKETVKEVSLLGKTLPVVSQQLDTLSFRIKMNTASDIQKVVRLVW